MKRNFSKVSEYHVRRLEVWLKEKNKEYCPFLDNRIKCWNDICYDVFPFLKKGDCPCDESTVKYVTRVARLVIHKCQR